MKLTLPIDSAVRKDVPVYSGCFMYFPAALAGVAMHSVAGNNKHNPGQELHHSRGKSNDHADCVVRHLGDMGDMLAYIARNGGDSKADPEVVKALLVEANANSWRALALSQELHERFGGAPLAPRARVEPPKVVDTLNVEVHVHTTADADAFEQYRTSTLGILTEAHGVRELCVGDGCYNNATHGKYCATCAPKAPVAI